MAKKNFILIGRECFEESECHKGRERIGEAIDIMSTSVGSLAVKHENIYTGRDDRGVWYLPHKFVEPMKDAIDAERGPAQVEGGKKGFAKVTRGEGGRFERRGVTIVSGGTNEKK